MSLKAPYLLFAFDVAPGTPGGSTIVHDVGNGLPITTTAMISLGANVFAVEVRASEANKRFLALAGYLALQDSAHGGVLQYVVQLCDASVIAVG